MWNDTRHTANDIASSSRMSPKKTRETITLRGAEPKLDQANSNAMAEKKAIRISVSELLNGEREAILEHRGQDYRLRITSTGKLILTK